MDRFALSLDQKMGGRPIPPDGTPIFVECTIEGSAQKLVLDTGASLLALDKKYLREESSVQGKGQYPSGESFVVPTGTGPPIKIQSFEIPNPQCAFFDLSDVSRRLGFPLAGMLGMDPCLAEAKLYFDHEQLLMTAHSGNWLIDGESEEVPLSQADNTPVITTQICGHDTKLIVDTGSSVSITLPKDLFDALVQEGAIKPVGKSLKSQTVGGQFQPELGVFLNGELMGKELRGVDVMVGRDRGSMGLRWLKNFNFEISFAERVLRYRPAQSR